MLNRVDIENYRSLRQVSIALAPLTVVTGPNGSGKSNLYKALGLVQAAAEGRFRQAFLADGGMPSALWAGPRGTGPVRMRLSVTFDDLSYELAAGVAQKEAPATRFVLDPQIKEEWVHIGPTRRRATTLLDRGVAGATVTGADGERHTLAGIDTGESILGQLGDPGRFPELLELRSRLAGWRFYHHFDTSRQAPARGQRPGVRTSVLATDGSDLAAAIATLEERGDGEFLHESVDAAFPGYRLLVDCPSEGVFRVGLEAPGLYRPLTGEELSDGQLRFLCLAMALLTTRPPELLVLNEPETSLHPGAVGALAPLIVEASRHGQVWITTHDRTLAEALSPTATVVELAMTGGATKAVTANW